MRITNDSRSVTSYHVYSNSDGVTQSFPAANPVGRTSTRDDIRKGDKVTPLPYNATFSDTSPVGGYLTLSRKRYWRQYANQPWQLSATTDLWKTPISYYTDTPFSAIPNVASTVTALTGIVQTKLLSKAVSINANVAMMYMERREAASLAKSLIQSVYSYTRAFVQRDWEAVISATGKSRKQLIRNTTNRHLAFIYGIMPMMSDVQGLLGMLEEPIEVKVRSRESDSTVYNHYVTRPFQHDENSHRREDWVPCIMSRTLNREVSARGVMRFELKSESIKRASDLGLLSPTYVVYDRIALSFVLSWFSNISSYLIALDSGLSVSPISFSVMSRVIDSYAYEAIPLYKTYRWESSNQLQKYESTLSGSSSYSNIQTVYKRTVGVVPPASLHTTDRFTTFAGFAAVSLLTQRYIKRMNIMHARASTPPGFRYKAIKAPYLPPIKYKV